MGHPRSRSFYWSLKMNGLTSLSMHFVVSIEVRQTGYPPGDNSEGFTTHNIILTDKHGNALEISAFTVADSPLVRNDLVITPPNPLDTGLDA